MDNDKQMKIISLDQTLNKLNFTVSNPELIQKIPNERIRLPEIPVIIIPNIKFIYVINILFIDNENNIKTSIFANSGKKLTFIKIKDVFYTSTLGRFLNKQQKNVLSNIKNNFTGLKSWESDWFTDTLRSNNSNKKSFEMHTYFLSRIWLK